MKIRYISLLFLLTLLNVSHIFAATLPISIEVRLVRDARMPIISCEIQAKSNNSIIDIPINQNSAIIFIKEDNYVIPAQVVSKTADNWYQINWIPNHEIIDFDYSAELVANIPSPNPNDHYVGNVDIEINAIKNAKVNVKYDGNSLAEDVYFYGVEPGKRVIRQIEVIAFKAKPNQNGFETPIVIDSISIDSPHFEWVWQEGNKFPAPPTSILGSFINLVDLYFTAPDDKSHTATLTIYYDGGAKKKVRLYGNKFSFENKNLLTLIYPNGNEKFAPCQEVNIRWKGHNKSSRTTIEFTTNNGVSWVNIGSTLDSTVLWQVPKSISSNVKIRVRQDLISNEPVLYDASKNIIDVEYSPNGSRMLSLGSNGTIEEWDPTGNKIAVYSRSNNTAKILNGVYLSNDSIAVASFIGSNTYIDIYGAGRQEAVRTIMFNSYAVSKIQYNAIKNEFYVLGKENWELHTIDALSGAYKFQTNSESFWGNLRIQAKSPQIQAANLWRYFTLYNPNAQQSIETQYDLSEFPAVVASAISPNQKIIAFAFKSGTAQSTRVYVFDFTSGKLIFRPQTSLFSDVIGLDFSANSTMLAIGHRAYPQINIVDLLNQKVVELASGGSGVLSDFSFSTDANEMIYAAGNSLFYRSFSYPELDESDNTFSIIEPILKIATVEAGAELMFDNHQKQSIQTICNEGEVPIVLKDNVFQEGKHFSIVQNQLPKTLVPGECIDLSYIFNPKDIGFVTDTLIFSYCGLNYKVAFLGEGIDRKISFTSNPFDLGVACIGDTITKQYILIKNDDPTEVIINKIEIASQNSKIFRVKNVISNFILKPDSTLKVEISGVPDTLGIIKGEVNVLYANQTKYKKVGNVQIQGIGTYVELSHQSLAFIEEIKERTITVKNIGVDAVFINSLIAYPNARFNVKTEMPVTILAGESKEFVIEWIGNEIEIGAFLTFDATPCLVQRYIPVFEYNANVTLKLENTLVNTLDSARIVINTVGNENLPYNGKRKFTMDFKMNKRIFFPLVAQSDFGTAKVTTKSVDADYRTITIEVEGNLAVNGRLATISGIPGLCETLQSQMNIQESEFYGVNTKVSTQDGLFTISSDCDNRLVIHTNNAINILSISPNPASGLTQLTYKSELEAEVEIKIFDNLGNLIHSEYSNQAKENKLNINLDSFVTGTYRVTVSNGQSVDSEEIIIVR